MDSTDAVLVNTTLKGDLGAYDTLVERYQRQVYSIAYRFVGNSEDAKDLTQEAFLRGFTRLNTFRQDASFRSWICRITSNLCIDRIRSRKGGDAFSLEQELENGWEPIACRDQMPEQQAIRNVVEKSVQDAVMSLPQQYRAVVVLRHLQDWSIAEIAEKLQLPEGTVKTHLFRARAILHKRLAPELGIEPYGK